MNSLYSNKNYPNEDAISDSSHIIKSIS